MNRKLLTILLTVGCIALSAVAGCAGDTPSDTSSLPQSSATDVSSEDSSEKTSSEDSSEAVSSEEESSKETSSKETSSKETSSKETSSKETSSKETSSKETSSKETSSEPVDDGKISIAKIKTSKMQALYERNKDTIGWIKIPNTNIDYGVVKENYSGEYLSLNYDKKYVKNGDSIWADAYNTFGTREQLSKNTIIYGHNWTNYKRPIKIGRSSDTHFAQLAAYDYLSFAKKNPYISFSTLEEEMYWQIFAVFYTETDFYYIDENPSSLTALTNEAIKRSIHNFGVEVTENDKILTLSTCTRVYNKEALAAGRRKDEQRFVVMAKLMPRNAELTPLNVTEHKDFKRPVF